MEENIESFHIIFSDNEENTVVPFNDDYPESIIGRGDAKIEILHPEEIRWFYRSNFYSENNICLSFSGYDSLRIETKFRELSSFKKDSSRESRQEMVIVKSHLFEADVGKRTCVPIYWTDTNDNYNIFRGTWFLADTFEPLMENLADAIESQFIMNFQALRYSSFKGSSQQKQPKILHQMDCGDYLIEWYELSEAYLFNTKSVTYKMKKYSMGSYKKFGQKIVRGYKEKATLEDKPQDIDHLCFIVHGIGQKLNTQIHRQCHKLKQTYKNIIQKYYSSKSDSQFRIEFLPIEWRGSLSLDGGIIDLITPQDFKGLRTILNNTVMDIFYYSSSLYKAEMIHSVQCELNRIYSMFCSRNPYFESKGGKVSIIAHSLGSVICYDIIKEWEDPDFNRNDSFSLDSQFQNSDDKKHKTSKTSDTETESNRSNRTSGIKFPLRGFKKANFPSNFKRGEKWKEVKKIENFFMLGSPLPVFLALRGFKPHNLKDYCKILPKEVCKNIFNIYHTSDPIAYRLEPLLHKEYFNIDPVHLHSLIPNDENSNYLNPKKSRILNLPYIQVPTPTESESSISNEDSDIEPNSRDIGSKITSTFRKFSQRKLILPAVDELQLKFSSLKNYSVFKRMKMFLNILKGVDESETSIFDETVSSIGYKENELLKNRLDYTLGDANGLNSYISLLTSHTGYWEEENLVKFIIDQMIKEC